MIVLTEKQVKLLEDLGFRALIQNFYVKNYHTKRFFGGSYDGYISIAYGATSCRVQGIYIGGNKQAQQDLAKLKEGGIE